MQPPIDNALPALLRKRFAALFGAQWHGKTYLVAVSGGLDSVSLLDLTLQILPRDQILVAHFDHRVRRRASRADAVWVSAYCKKREVVCFLGGRRGVKTSEAALREERYKFLAQVRTKAGADFLLTAHHSEDQLETMLMRLIRGTGLTGVGAMAAKTGRLARPLLGVSKDRLHAYARDRGLRYRTDATNAEPAYFRNRIRHQLLPPLFSLAEEHGGKERFLMRTEQLLSELRSVARHERRETETLFKTLCTDTAFWLRLPPKEFAELSPGRQRQLVRRVLAHFQISEVSRGEVERVRAFLLSTRTRIQTLGGQLIERSCGEIYFLKKSPLGPGRWLYRKGRWVCPALGITLQARPGVVPRFFQAGDRQGRQKLKKLFLELGIPAPERALLPVLVDQRSNEVVWFYPQTHARVRVIESRFPFTRRLSIDA